VGTVRRAINILVKEGLVETVPGRGTFVIEQRPSGSPGGQQTPARPQAGRLTGRPRPHGHIRHPPK
jgi:DNA-binding GntR family transcriptional regulator